MSAKTRDPAGDAVDLLDYDIVCRGVGCPFRRQCMRWTQRLRHGTEKWGYRRKDGLWECRMYESTEQDPRA